MKKFLKITAFSILGFFLVLLLIPIFFKGAIVEAVKKEINNQIDATVEFKDVSVSLIRNFPHLNLRLNELSVTGKGEFEDIKLADVETFGFVFNLSSLWKKDQPYEIRSLIVDGLDLNLITLSDGSANYMIMKDAPELEDTEEVLDEGESELTLLLHSYRILNSNIIWDDRSTNTYVKVNNLDHRGSGNFTAEKYQWESRTNIKETAFSYGGINYLSRVPIDWTLELDVDNSERVISIIENSLLLSKLSLDLDGMVAYPEAEPLFFDLRINAPGNDFYELFSVLPLATLSDLDDLTVRGNFNFDASVKGSYEEEGPIYPAFYVNFDVEDGFVQYPEMDLPLESIGIDLKVNSPDSDLDNMTLELTRFNLLIAQNPVAGNLFLSNPISDPNIISSFNGKLDLAELSKVFPMEGMESLRGMIDLDFNTAFVWSQIEAENYDEITLNGTLSIENIAARMQDMPDINVPFGGLKLAERSTEFHSTRIEIGKNNFEFEGTMDNVLKLWGSTSPMAGQIKLKSGHLDIDDLMDKFLGETDDEQEVVADATREIPAFYNVNLDIEVEADKVIFRPYYISEIRSNLNVKPHLLDLKEVSLVINESDIRGKATLQNWYEFAMAGERLTIDAELSGGTIYVEKLIEYTEPEIAGVDSPTREEEPIQATVPDYRYNIHLTGRADKVIYSPYELKNTRVRSYITERDVHLEAFSSEIFGDRISVSGFIGNYMAYAFLDETLLGELSIDAPSLNINRWMEAMVAEDQQIEVEEVQLDDMEPIRIPGNLDFAIQGKVGSMEYFNMPFREVSGLIEIIDGALQIKDFSGNLFRGKMIVNGLYDTAEEIPFMNMKLDLETLDIPASFQHISTLAAIGPLFEYMSGQFSSSLILDTRLDQGMMPIWNSFNAEGFVKTLNARINDLPALAQAADRLQLNFLRRLNLDDTENWFQIEGGRFELKPINHTISETDMVFSGFHQIGGEMEYHINASVPKDLIGKGTVGSGVVSGLNFIQSKASERGFDLGGGSHVDVGIRISGSLRNPTIGIDLLGVSTEESLRDRAESEVRDRIEEEKKALEDRAREELDERRTEIEDKVESGIDTLRERAREKEQELLDKARKEAESKLKDVLKDTTDTTIEEMKERARRFNPFRKQNDDG